MNIKPEKYVRKPFEVEAIEVTEENMAEVALWCGGTVLDSEDGPRSGSQRYVKVPVKRPISDRQTRAYVGDWVLLATTSDRDAGPAGFKVYTPKAFTTSFQKQVDDMIDTLTRMDERAKAEERAEEQDEIPYPVHIA